MEQHKVEQSSFGRGAHLVDQAAQGEHGVNAHRNDLIANDVILLRSDLVEQRLNLLLSPLLLWVLRYELPALRKW